MSDKKNDGAQFQHYVPRHILRSFLSDDPKEAAKEQVRVIDLQTKRTFTTGLQNIMGERRYNDFWIDDETMATIEPATSKIEGFLLPTINRVRENRRLALTLEEHGLLAFLIAFQFIRTKGLRDQWIRMEEQFQRAIEGRGWKMEQVEGWTPPTKETIKAAHVRLQLKSLDSFTEILADKAFFLAEPPKGLTYYISDNPVVMANDHPVGFHGKLGLKVPYVQIYLPLASDLMLCAYGKELIGRYIKDHKEGLEKAQQFAFAKMWQGKITGQQMKLAIERASASDGLNSFIQHLKAGTPIPMEDEQALGMNRLQGLYASRYVIDSRGNFDAALTARRSRERQEAEEAKERQESVKFARTD